MNNNYDQILRDKLQGVNSTPPAGLWSKIEASLPATEGSAAFDQAVKGKLANVVSNPPVGLWTKIGAAIHGTPFYKTTIFKWSAAAVVLISAFIGWDLLDENQGIIPISMVKENIEIPVNHSISKAKSPVNHSISAKTPIKNLESNRIQTSTSKATIGASKNTEKIAEKVVAIQSEKLVSIKEEKRIAQKQVVSSFTNQENSNNQQVEKIQLYGSIDVNIDKSNTVVVNKQTPSLDTLHNENNNLKVKSQSQNKKPSVAIAENDNQGNDHQDVTSPIENKTKDKIKSGSLPRNPRNLNKYGIQINYSPTYVNTSVNKINKQDFNIALAYQNINFIADLGFGVGFSSEKNNFTVDYKHYEFVKTQFVTDSMSFVYDPGTQTYNPVAVGHHEKVYDDVKYSYSSEVTTNYTYLNIPLNVGYIKEFKYFDLFAKGGLNYSMVISKAEKGNFVPDEYTTIVSKDYSSRTRLQSNISYNLAFGSAITLHQKLKLTGEIIGGYYQNSIYSDINYRPYSYGVRFGLIYFVK